MALRNAFADLATEPTLAAILTELGQKLETGGPVALDAATLAALEQVIVSSPALTLLASSQVAVSTVVVPVPATNQAGRAGVSVRALTANTQPIYIGLASVTTTTGWELGAGESIDLDAAANIQLYAVAVSGTQRVAVLELG